MAQLKTRDCRKIKSSPVCAAYELGPFTKPAAVATRFMNSKVARSKSEGSGFGEMCGDESRSDYAGGVSPEGTGTARCQLSSQEVSRGAGNQNPGTRSPPNLLSREGRLETLRHFLVAATGPLRQL